MTVEGTSAASDARSQAARRGRRQLALLWGAAALSLLVLAPFGTTVAGLFGGAFGGCPVKQMTGWPCPSCGTTRAALGLARLDVLGSLVRYPLPTLAWMVFIAGGLASAAWTLAGRELPAPPRVPRWAIGAGVAAVLLNWSWSIYTGV